LTETGPGVDADTGAAAAAWTRHDELAERTSRLRGVSGAGAERWFQMAGWVLPPVGVVLVLLGWYGTASTSRVWQQIPYLASGGMLGIAFIFTGGLAYLASWLTKLVNDSGAQAAAAAAAAERTAMALERIEALLESAVSGTGSAGFSGPRLVATATGSMVHLPDCPMVEGRDNLRTVAADEPGMRPCLVCQPQLAAVNGGSSTR
jgi:hypothetical protein